MGREREDEIRRGGEGGNRRRKEERGGGGMEKERKEGEEKRRENRQGEEKRRGRRRQKCQSDLLSMYSKQSTHRAAECAAVLQSLTGCGQPRPVQMHCRIRRSLLQLANTGISPTFTFMAPTGLLFHHLS